RGPPRLPVARFYRLLLTLETGGSSDYYSDMMSMRCLELDQCHLYFRGGAVMAIHVLRQPNSRNVCVEFMIGMSGIADHVIWPFPPRRVDRLRKHDFARLLDKPGVHEVVGFSLGIRAKEIALVQRKLEF